MAEAKLAPNLPDWMVEHANRYLASGVPVPDPDAKRDRFTLAGEIPSPLENIVGCRLRGRCPLAQPVCANPVPLREIEPGRFVACHLA